MRCYGIWYGVKNDTERSDTNTTFHKQRTVNENIEELVEYDQYKKKGWIVEICFPSEEKTLYSGEEGTPLIDDIKNTLDVLRVHRGMISLVRTTIAICLVVSIVFTHIMAIITYRFNMICQAIYAIILDFVL